MTSKQIKKFKYRSHAEVSEGEEDYRILLRSLFNLRKPSDIIDVMCYGLRRQARRRDFRVAMSSFGALDAPGSFICVGCAATAALGTLLPHAITAESLGLRREGDSWYARQISSEVHRWALDYVEDFWDRARTGAFVFAAWVKAGELSDELHREFFRLPTLTSDSWYERLPRYEEWAKKAREVGY